MPVRRGAALAAPLLCFVCLPAALRAQAERVQGLPACEPYVIRNIIIEPSVLFAEPSDKRVVSDVAHWVGNAFSWRTREATVRRELRFEPGQPCEADRLVESARVLRAQTYLRSAEIVTTPPVGDSVDVIVRVRDEWGLDGSVRVDTDPVALRAVRLTEQNLLGIGMLYQLRYDNLGRQPGYVVDVLHRQFPGRTDAELVAGRTSTGPVLELAFRRVFESEYDDIAWRADGRRREEPFALGSESLGTVIQPLGSIGFNTGIARRYGQGGQRFLAGVTISYERLFIDGTPLASDPADDSAATAALAGRFAERRRFSTDILLGYRNVRFINRAGVDAVDAVQDLRDGFEVRLLAGHGWSMGNKTQPDWFWLADLYAGRELGRTLLFARSRSEARWIQSTRVWEGVIATAELYSYTRAGPRTVLHFNVQAAGGWNTSTPFQLMLSGENGMRGFGLGALPVGRRVVAQAEHRYLLGTIFRAADLGTTLFVDAGQGWAGDAPFARNTGFVAAAGAGLRGAFPSGSRVTSRVDLAVPLSGGTGVEFRLTLRRSFGITSPEPDDVERSRLPAAALEPFQFTRY